MSVSTQLLVRFTRATLIFCALATAAGPARSQLVTFSKQDLVDYSAQSPFERFPDGRPKVPDNLLQQARELSSEEVWAVLQEKGFNNQYADGFRILHPDKPMVGRAFTVQFMPQRPDLEHIANSKAKEHGLPQLTNQTAIDMLQPGDVLVVDIFGKKVGGTVVGDNLFYYVMTATKGGGLVVDGSIRDLNGISEIDMPAYFKDVDPTPIDNVMLTGINVPIRIGGVTVMPGDLVVGDRDSTALTKSASMTSGPKRNLPKGSTNPAKSTALPKIPNWSRSIRNTSSSACKKFVASAAIPNRHANPITAGISSRANLQ